MPFCQHLEFDATNAYECLNELENCEDVMKCACCAYALERKKQIVVDNILSDVKKLPKEITRIKIPILPTPTNKNYYNFIGIETIVFNTLKTQNEKQLKSLQKQKAFLKVYYENNSLFTLPIIQIEIIFFGRLHSMIISELWETLRTEVLFFTGTLGDIDVIEVRGRNQLTKLLQIPLLFGYSQFKMNGVLLEHDFSQEQIYEMNYLHAFIIQPLEMKEVINNNVLDLFEHDRELITMERISKGELPQNDADEDVNDFIRTIFKSHPQRYDSHIEDELPF